MTFGDLLKRVNLEKDKHKMLLLREDNGGWANVNIKITYNEISIIPDGSRPFSSDNENESYLIPSPSGDWIDPTKPTPQYNYSTTTTPNKDWQKSVRYI